MGCVDVLVACLCLALGIEGEIVPVAFSFLCLGLNELIRFSCLMVVMGCHLIEISPTWTCLGLVYMT